MGKIEDTCNYRTISHWYFRLHIASIHVLLCRL